jgi:hypothetical protein
MVRLKDRKIWETALNSCKQYRTPAVLMLLLCFGAGAHAQRMSTGRDTRPMLQLKATVVDSTYCEASNLRLTLQLTFHNTGSVPILLRKEGFRIGRYLINRDLGARRKGKREADVVPMMNSLWVLMNRLEGRTIDESVFVKLEPGGSYIVPMDLHLPFVQEDDSPSPDSLRRGNYLLQVLVWTWLDTETFANHLQYEKNADGFLWTKSVMSELTPFSVGQNKKIKDCN